MPNNDVTIKNAATNTAANTTKRSTKVAPGTKLRDADKMAHIPIKVVTSTRESMLRKPSWLRIKLPRSSERIDKIKANLRKHNLLP